MVFALLVKAPVPQLHALPASSINLAVVDRLRQRNAHHRYGTLFFKAHPDRKKWRKSGRRRFRQFAVSRFIHIFHTSNNPDVSNRSHATMPLPATFAFPSTSTSVPGDRRLRLVWLHRLHLAANVLFHSSAPAEVAAHRFCILIDIHYDGFRLLFKRWQVF